MCAAAAAACALAFVKLGFHDCVQPRSLHRRPTQGAVAAAASDLSCNGGLCVGMHNGPHEGGPASYPAGNRQDGFTRVSSTMTVPEKPKKIDGITYYVWTDIFFGDMSLSVLEVHVVHSCAHR